jgi:hypothetical protein
LLFGGHFHAPRQHAGQVFCTVHADHRGIPRLFDFAGLDTDILLAILDCENGRELSFNRIDDWYRLASSAFPFKRLSQLSMGNRASFLRSAAHVALKEKLEGVSQMEYAEVFTFNLLRYLRFSSIAFPKKILATRLIHKMAAQFGLLS